MAKDDEDIQPIVRKGGQKDEANEPVAEEPQADVSAVEAKPAEEQPAEATQAPGRSEAPTVKLPLGRRVVDMRNEPAGGRQSESPTSPERPSVRTQERQGITVEQGSLEDFEALLAEAGGAAAPRQQRVDVGEKREGRVTKIGDKWIYVDLGQGLEGLARRDDFVDKEGRLKLEQGESYAFYVLGTNEGSILLGDQLSTREAAMDAVETALQTGVPLTGRVAGKNKGGFEIDLGGVRAFCPISQIELAYTENPDAHLGASYKFLVTEVREGGRSVVVSRAALQRQEAERAREKTMETLAVGDVVDGTVTRLANFGAFVDLGGIEGLVHISELGFVRVDHPSELVREGERLKVTVLSIDRDDPKGPRISLSAKDAMEDPWVAAQRDLHPGKRVNGTVTRLEPFGAFVEVSPNVEGLVHVSELSWDHVKRPSDVVSVGQTISVEVLDVDLARRRISLSAKAAAGDPWNDALDRYKPGIEVTGTVENVEEFGAFVSLGSGITALIPKSEMGLARESSPHARFSKGDEVTARILSIEPDRRRIALTMKSAEEVADQAGSGPRTYTDTSKGLGTLGDLLKDKLK